MTTYFDVSTGAQDLSKPTKIITDKGSGVSETTLITYNTDGTRTETTTSTANPNESTVVVRNADGTERSRTTVTSDARTETSNGIRTITDANGRVTSQVPVDAEGKPISYTHEVKPGDTWYGIVQAKYGITDPATTMAVIRKLKSENNVDRVSKNIPKNITLLPTIDLGNGKTVSLTNLNGQVNHGLNAQYSRIDSLKEDQKSISFNNMLTSQITLGNVYADNKSKVVRYQDDNWPSPGWVEFDDQGRAVALYESEAAAAEGVKDERIYITYDGQGKVATVTINDYDAAGNPIGGIEYDSQGNFSRRWVNYFPPNSNGANDGWTHKVFYDADGKYLRAVTNQDWYEQKS